MSDPGAPLVLRPPLAAETAAALAAGQAVLVSGVIYTARDRAHLRLKAALERGEPLPFDPAGQIIYYTGPTPAPPGRALGAAGPTTAARMDPLTEPLLAAGVRATIGKGARSPELLAALKRHGAVYLAATGGAGALLGGCVTKAEVIAYEDLGLEALRRLEVVDLPLIVAADSRGGDIFRDGPAAYASASG